MPNAVVIIGLLLIGVILAIGVRGGFQFDDYPNIVDAPSLHAQALSLPDLYPAISEGLSGPTGRPLSLLSFAAGHAIHGLDPVAFKAVNIAVHLLNGLLCYVLGRLLLNRAGLTTSLSQRVAVVVALAWTAHPLQVSSVLYVVQRMNELSALFSLLACVCYCVGRERLIRDQPRGWGLLILSLTLWPAASFLSKENGALTPLYLLLIEACFFRLQCAIPGQRRLLPLVLGLLAAGPVLAVLLYSALQPAWFLSGYATRDFTFGERVFTEARVFWTYLTHIVWPDPTEMGLYRDDYRRSVGLMSPITTLSAVLGLGALLATGGWFAIKGPRLVGFGILFFLAGHSMESTIIALELVFEHRNYLPSFGILLAIGGFLGPKIAAKLPPTWPALTASLVLLILTGLTAIRAYAWGEPLRWIETEVINHPTSPRAQRDYATQLHQLAAKLPDPEKRRSMLEKAALHAAAADGFAPLQSEHLLTFVLIQNDLGHRPLESFWPIVVEKIQRGTVSASAVTQLQALTQCQIRKDCGFPAAAIQVVLDTAAAKPELRLHDRAILLHAAGVHAFWTGLDRSKGIILMEQAIERDGGKLYLRPNLVRALAADGHRDLARQQLEKARTLDRSGAFSRDWQMLENELRSNNDQSKGGVRGEGNAAAPLHYRL